MSRRTERISEAVREVVSTAILFEVKDPRVKGVTVVRVEVTGDLRQARVFVSIMGDEREQRLCEYGLKSSTGFLQRRIAERLDLRYTPVLEIVVDDSIKKSIEMSRLLREAASEESAAPAAIEEEESHPDAPAD
jgi:ribosome-binding factor A